MSDLSSIAGCFPDVWCMASLLHPRPVVLDGLVVLSFVMELFIGAMVVLCIVASLEGGK
mgnify:CR=1 FL=1